MKTSLSRRRRRRRRRRSMSLYLEVRFFKNFLISRVKKERKRRNSKISFLFEERMAG